MCQSESVQYFQFDSEGNMFVYPAGAGFSGEPHLVRPGDEIFGSKTFENSDATIQSTSVCDGDAMSASYSAPTQNLVSSSRMFKKPLDEEKLEE